MTRSYSTILLALGISLSALAPALAAAPTEAQQQAIRSNCVKDYRAHCSSVPTGGMDALICLEQNVDSLSPACKTAVEAVEPATDTTSTTAAAPAASTPATTAAKPADTATSAAPAAKTASAPAMSPANEPKLTLRQELAIAGGSCAVDFRLFCPNLPIGHGNILFCLQVHGQRLAPACRDVLVKLGVNLWAPG
jgi:pyruvate/2-oxoglutarate dehydrogenase complex dihydrolipoamide acyltransferase (E2) component